MRSLPVLILVVLFLFSGCTSDVKNDTDAVKDSTVVIVNEKEITEEEIEAYAREVVRDRADENLSEEEIREDAIERAIRWAAIKNYLEKKGVTASEKEVLAELSLRMLEEEGVETDEEYFDLMAKKGYSREEVERNIKMDIKIGKAFNLILQDIEVTEEEAYQYYKQLEEEGADLVPFEEIKETAQEDVAHIMATDQLIRDFDKAREGVQVEIME